MKKSYARSKNWVKKPLFRFTAVLLCLLLLLFFLRRPLLRTMYTYLDVSENLSFNHAVYGIILSGNAGERAAAAAALYHRGLIDTLVCTGANIPPDLAILGYPEPESVLSRHVLLQNQVPPQRILLLDQGTSTIEEMQLIHRFSQKRSGSLLIITSATHTRRVWRLRKKIFPREQDIHCFGTPPQQYDPHAWWTSEQGLIAVNTEWQKLLYYYWKY